MDYSENSFNFTSAQELNMYYCGQRIKTLNHSYGPYIKNHILINFVVEGNATLYVNDKKYRINANQIFVMFPNSKIYYEADKGSLWTIKWVGLYGDLTYKYLDMLGISYNNPIFDILSPSKMEHILDELFIKSSSSLLEDKLKCISLLHEFFSVLFKDIHINYNSNDYIEAALNLMRFNYDKAITVADIAKELNINSNYFSKLFKKETGMSPIDMLHSIKIDRACFLLQNTKIPISEIAHAIGIPDQFYFCRFFKKHIGKNPSEYRKETPNSN